MPSFGVEMLIKDEFRTLLDNEVSEKWVSQIINKSKYVFNGLVPFERIKQEYQYNGECDFVSTRSDFEIDLKIFLPQDFCEALRTGKGLKFDSVRNLTALLNEGNEKLQGYISGYVQDSKLEKFLRKYKTKLLRELKKYNVLVFHPFPIMKFTGSFTNMSTGTIDNWLREVLEESNSDYSIYFIAPNLENKIYLANLNDYMSMEFIEYQEFFDKFIKITRLTK